MVIYTYILWKNPCGDNKPIFLTHSRTHVMCDVSKHCGVQMHQRNVYSTCTQKLIHVYYIIPKYIFFIAWPTIVNINNILFLQPIDLLMDNSDVVNKILYVSFNNNSKFFSAGTERGFKIFSSAELRELASKSKTKVN